MSVILIESEQQFNDLITQENVTVVMFSAPWCGNCKIVHPKLVKLSKELTDVTFAKLDTTEFEDLAMELNVAALPTFKIYKEGKILHDYTGSKWEKIDELIRGAIN
ncbi:thioredoxin [Thraustotheca clavata]|uniref:Thioredoxin n=1 Tax=Thraustotheca clavata TaxID=74557 RepID=A0A1V9Z159_9STRA|nr:thioredoxin [Thraustotheca clavata]